MFDSIICFEQVSCPELSDNLFGDDVLRATGNTLLDVNTILICANIIYHFFVLVHKIVENTFFSFLAVLMFFVC